MYKIILESLSTLLSIFERNDNRKDEVSLSSRKALSETRSYIWELEAGMDADRKRERDLSLAWAEAASKVRRFSSELEYEFYGLSTLFSDGKVSADSGTELRSQLDKIVGLLRDRNMMIAQISPH